MNAELFGCHFCSGDAVRYLLEGNITGIVWVAMIGFLVDAERREAAIIGRPEPLLVNVFRGSNQLITYFLCRFWSWALRHDAANISHLGNPIGVVPQVLSDQLVGCLSIASLAICI
jgi:hypothetical protein